jgi:VanZ family protein
MWTLTKRIQDIKNRWPRSTWLGALTVLWTLFIGIISLLPSSRLTQFESWNFLGRDKVAHILVYAILSTIFSAWLIEYKNDIRSASRLALLSLIPVILYGALLEWMQQTFQPGRFAELADIVANSLGAGVGLLIVLIYYRKQFHFPEWPSE